jgi:hypothetical protein
VNPSSVSRALGIGIAGYYDVPGPPARGHLIQAGFPRGHLTLRKTEDPRTWRRPGLSTKCWLASLSAAPRRRLTTGSDERVVPAAHRGSPSPRFRI